MFFFNSFFFMYKSNTLASLTDHFVRPRSLRPSNHLTTNYRCCVSIKPPQFHRLPYRLSTTFQNDQRFVEQGSKDHNHNPQQPKIEEKVFTDDELVALIDPILKMDDTSRDGYIDYPEFIRAQEKAAANQQNQQQQQQQQHR